VTSWVLHTMRVNQHQHKRLVATQSIGRLNHKPVNPGASLEQLSGQIN